MNDWLIWQISDSAFPAGGFVHSGGVEAAAQHGLLPDGDALAEFLRSAAAQLDRGVMQFVRLAWQQPLQFAEHDEQCDRFLNNHVANRASRAQGQAFLASIAKTFQTEKIVAFAARARQDRMPAHFAPVFGLLARELDLGQEKTLQLFLFISLRGALSAAIRLGIVGPIEAQQIQAKLAAEFAERASQNIDSPMQTSPLFDLLQGTQDRLYSRLFQS